MASPGDTDVGAAFELLIESLAIIQKTTNDEGAKAFQRSNHSEVDLLNVKARKIQEFVKRVDALQDEWLNLVDANDVIEERGETADSSFLELSMSYEGAVAKAKYGPRIVTLLEGSTIRGAALESLSDPLRELRQRCEKDGRLVVMPGEPLLKLTNSLAFRSPSAAAKFVAGCSVSGNIYWLVEPSRLALGQYLRRASRTSGRLASSNPTTSDASRRDGPKPNKLDRKSDIKWKDDVKRALQGLGGRALLGQIYEAVRTIRKDAGRSLPPKFNSSVRQTLETYSSDSENYKKGEDLFCMPEGKGAGVWALR
jgi:hypothetical protein